MTWGYSKNDGEDIYYIGGKGTSKADRALLHVVLACDRYRAYALPNEPKWDKSLIKELEDRGYDITTIEFKIKKKICEPASR